MKAGNCYKRINEGLYLACSMIVLLLGAAACNNGNDKSRDRVRSVQIKLMHQDSNLIKTSWPSVGCWFWSKEEFEGEGYKKFIDLHAAYSPFKLLTTSLRYPGDLTDPQVHRRIKKASLYAKSKGMDIVMDLDVRLARDSFKAKYPDELQQLVLLKEFSLKGDNPSIGIKGHDLNDHYTYGRTPYGVESVKLLRLYSYNKQDGLIQSGSIKDISNLATTSATRDSIHITLRAANEALSTTACALVAVTLNTPDVFAPHLLSYQRAILQRYADASLAGACKDEWGFPGRFTTPTDELWYSAHMAKIYNQQRSGRDLLSDLLLMSKGETGKQAQRTAAINHYMEMNTQRNGAIETDYYYAIKEILGKEAMSATHPTWFPYPDNREIFKNGLSWWTSKRDLTQTDEATPFSVRTALAKKMYSPLWFNMYYDKAIEPYYKDIWRAALAGGRLNYHPLWPIPVEQLTTSLLKDSVMLAESRVSLLNYIAEAPPDCKVAVVFGHPAAQHWANKETFADVGLKIANALWQMGHYTDLIPSSEITNGALKINGNGKVQYGPQEYEVVVFYHPEYDKASVATFFKNAANTGKTNLFRVGNWTTDFDGKPFAGNKVMGSSIKQEDTLSVVSAVAKALQAKNIAVQTEGEQHTVAGFPVSVMPKAAGQLRLIDGTHIFVSGENHALGDLIFRKLDIAGQQLDVDAIGVVGIRLNKQGDVEALACGGLKSLKVGSFSLNLAERADIALIKEDEKWKGIIHCNNNAVPDALLALTADWQIVNLPAIHKY